MICRSCRQQDHATCKGATWCDCGHVVVVVAEEKTAGDNGDTDTPPR